MASIGLTEGVPKLHATAPRGGASPAKDTHCCEPTTLFQFCYSITRNALYSIPSHLFASGSPPFSKSAAQSLFPSADWQLWLLSFTIGRRLAGLRLGDRLFRSPLNIFLIILPEMFPRFNNSSASCAEKSGGSEAAPRMESLRLRIEGDRRADDSRSLPLAFATERASGSEGVGATEASWNSLSYRLVLTLNLKIPCLPT